MPVDAMSPAINCHCHGTCSCKRTIAAASSNLLALALSQSLCICMHPQLPTVRCRRSGQADQNEVSTDEYQARVRTKSCYKLTMRFVQTLGRRKFSWRLSLSGSSFGALSNVQTKERSISCSDPSSSRNPWDRLLECHLKRCQLGEHLFMRSSINK